MENPFVLFSDKLLDSLIKAGNTHFVRQTYPRGTDKKQPQLKGAFLITHYSDRYRAQTHYDALVNDAHRFLYDTDNPAHQEKLSLASYQPPGYKIYSPLMQGPWKPDNAMKEHIRKYISENVNWMPARADTIKADLFTQFGELFINLKYGTEEVKVRLEDIEKY